MNYVLVEMKLLWLLFFVGDYLVVEDFNINGYLVLFGFGFGFYEVIEVYEDEFLNDYKYDVEWENKFGWIFVFNGFLICN